MRRFTRYDFDAKCLSCTESKKMSTNCFACTADHANGIIDEYLKKCMRKIEPDGGYYLVPISEPTDKKDCKHYHIKFSREPNCRPRTTCEDCGKELYEQFIAYGEIK